MINISFVSFSTIQIKMKKLTLFFILICSIGCHRSNQLNSGEGLSMNSNMIHLKYFGNVDSSNDQTTIWQKQVDFDGQKVRMDLNFPDDSNKKSLLLGSKTTLDKLEKVVQNSRVALNQDYKNQGFTKDFIVMHLEWLQKEDYEFLKIDHQLSKDKKETGLLKSTELRRIGIFLDDFENHIILDYAISKNGLAITNDLLVLKYNKNYQLTGITTES